MITLLNRKELCSTYSMKEQAEVRKMLEDAGIDYQVKTVNRKSPSPIAPGSRAYTGTLGENLDMGLEYQIYVRREDYEQAAILTGK